MAGRCLRLVQPSMTWDAQHGARRRMHHDRTHRLSVLHGSEKKKVQQDGHAACRHTVQDHQQQAA